MLLSVASVFPACACLYFLLLSMLRKLKGTVLDFQRLQCQKLKKLLQEISADTRATVPLLMHARALQLILIWRINTVKITGTPHGWDVLFYIFQFIRVTVLFTVIVLIGTGWSFLKPFLQEQEKKVLMIVIPLQVLANLASVVIRETGPFIRDWVTWNQVFLLVDIICCCAIIFPIVWIFEGDIQD